MDGAGLSDHERRILSEIESQLEDDQDLERKLRTMRGQRSPRTVSRIARTVGVKGLTVCVLGVTSLILLISAVLTVSSALLWVFAVTWTLTLIMAVRLVARRWRERRRKRPQGRGKGN
jgi:Flp pilus assembly protein TadB